MTGLLIPLSALAYVGVWIIFMASPTRRSIRSVLFLSVTSIPLVLAASAEPRAYAAVAAVDAHE